MKNLTTKCKNEAQKSGALRLKFPIHKFDYALFSFVIYSYRRKRNVFMCNKPAKLRRKETQRKRKIPVDKTQNYFV